MKAACRGDRFSPVTVRGCHTIHFLERVKGVAEKHNRNKYTGKMGTALCRQKVYVGTKGNERRSLRLANIIPHDDQVFTTSDSLNL